MRNQPSESVTGRRRTKCDSHFGCDCAVWNAGVGVSDLVARGHSCARTGKSRAVREAHFDVGSSLADCAEMIL